MKKQLLNESEIRKMMKFANISPLSDGFVGRLDETAETTPLEEEETLEEEDALEEDVVEEGAHDEDDDDDKKKDVKEGMGHYKADDDMADDMGDDMGDDMDEPMDEPMMDEPAAEAGEMELTEEEADVLIKLGERLAAAAEPGEEMVDDEMPMPDMGEPEEEAMELEEDFVNEVLSRVVRRLKDSK